MSLVFALPDIAATESLGRGLADLARSGDLIALEGPLGAGKTVLARAFIRHLLGPSEDVPSPTFTLMQTYPSRRGTIFHYDLFRLRRPEEALELGIDESLADGIALIEWPERLGAHLPALRLDVRLFVDPGSDARRAEIDGAAWGDRLDGLAAATHA